MFILLLEIVVDVNSKHLYSTTQTSNQSFNVRMRNFENHKHLQPQLLHQISSVPTFWQYMMITIGFILIIGLVGFILLIALEWNRSYSNDYNSSTPKTISSNSSSSSSSSISSYSNDSMIQTMSSNNN